MRGQEVAVKQRVVARRVGRPAATERACGAAVDVRQQSALGSGTGDWSIVRVSGFRGVKDLVVIKEKRALAVGERHGEFIESTYGTVCEICRGDDIPVSLPRPARGGGRLMRQTAQRQRENPGS